MGDLADTICALSTAPGRAGIAVVRVSGPECLALMDRVFQARRDRGTWKAREAQLGSIAGGAGGADLDRMLVTRFPAPHSYTGEDVAEISIHGNPVLIAALLERLCAVGARLAEPGEFTLRSFLNGKMDLIQAEAVRDIIEARTLFQAQVAARQHAGSLSRELTPVKTALVGLIGGLEAAVEFSDEVIGAPREQAAMEMAGIHADLGKWIATFRHGRIVHDGFSLAIAGRPNVGKSSLFNYLLSRDRSIVTEIPGTTRDLVSESVNMEGIPVRLVDTAGVRRSEDRIESLGVDRSYGAMADADAVLLIVDRSRPPEAEDVELSHRLAGLACILVFNKADLEDRWKAVEKEEHAGAWPWIEVSAMTGAGIAQLRAEIWRRLFGDGTIDREGLMITNLRQVQSLKNVAAALERAMEALAGGLSEEFVLVDLRECLASLGEVTGETGTEDILTEIFSRFCIGK